MRLHALQYLRAAAALAVVYSHAAMQVDAYAPYLPERGSFGVDVFFVISGFIMVWITKPGDTPGRFFVNRLRRVVPLYWFFTLLMALILVVAPSIFKRTSFDWTTLLTSLAFVPYPSTAHPGFLWPLVAPGWSLNYEMYFYLLFALSLLLGARLRVAGVVVLLLSVMLVARLSGSSSPAALFYGDTIVLEFVFGMLLALAWRRGWRLPGAHSAVLVASGVLLLLAELPLPRILAYGLPALAIVAGCLHTGVPERRWALVLGDASYALYLSHLFTLGALRKALPPLLGDGALAAWSFVAIALVVCTAVSVVVHYLIDNWLLRHERLGLAAPPGGRARPVRGARTQPGTAPREGQA